MTNETIKTLISLLIMLGGVYFAVWMTTSAYQNPFVWYSIPQAIFGVVGGGMIWLVGSSTGEFDTG